MKRRKSVLRNQWIQIFMHLSRVVVVFGILSHWTNYSRETFSGNFVIVSFVKLRNNVIFPLNFTVIVSIEHYVKYI